MTNLPRLAILGAGHIGPVIARLAIKAGYPVSIAASGDPDDIRLVTELIITVLDRAHFEEAAGIRSLA